MHLNAKSSTFLSCILSFREAPKAIVAKDLTALKKLLGNTNVDFNTPLDVQNKVSLFFLFSP
jgi:hypothetical protein